LHSMPRDVDSDASDARAWQRAQAELGAARTELASALPGISRQAVYVRLLVAQRRCTALVHRWLAEALHLERVVDPRLVLSLDVDGVLEDEAAGFSATSLTGAAALRLLQLGRVAVLLNTGRSLAGVRDRVQQFVLPGGVAVFGAALWDNVFLHRSSLLSDRGKHQLSEFRTLIRAEPAFVQDPSHQESVRVSRVVDGTVMPIPGPDARALLDHHGFTDLTFWVGPRHTDFVDRRADKFTGLTQLREELGLDRLPLAAIGDGACDISTLRSASRAFVPAAALPSYAPSRSQTLVRSRYLGEEALWDGASRLVPDPSLRRRVRVVLEGIVFPEWFPSTLRRRLPPTRSRLANLRRSLFTNSG
jgi:hydroxymethylpyrimidine pyrophosphatase-like HAD family hydrolase